MDFQQIEVIIDKQGKVQIEVQGVKGPACLDLTKALEEALGGDVEERRMTPEADEQQQELSRNEQWLGGGGKDDWA